MAILPTQAVFREFFGIHGFGRGAPRHAITVCYPKSCPGDIPVSVMRFVPNLRIRHPLYVRNSVPIKLLRLPHGNLQAKGESLHSQPAPEKPAQQSQPLHEPMSGRFVWFRHGRSWLSGLKHLSDTSLGPIGEYGDGRRVEQPVTVATFASALRNVETLGNRFDLLVIDEVHHFGAGAGDEVLEMCTAPARLGLSATPPEDEVRRSRLDTLVGPEVYRASVEELAGRYLASFQLITISIGLTPSERQAYDAEMSVFRPVCRAFFEAAPGASWSDFVVSAGRSDSGRRALAAWRRSRTVVRYNAEKRRIVNDLLLRHHDSRILIFAADNDTAYSVAREHLVQPITCDIGKKERAQALQRFSTGRVANPRIGACAQ